jgi:hypothetical protein
MLPFGRPLRIQLQAGGSPGIGEQQVQRGQIGSLPLPALRPAFAFQSFRFGFPLASLHALTGLVAMVVMRVHDAS